MIIIRGIKGESYARKIEDGIVDCRDILSALLKPPVTGYEYSDYYEKNLVKALLYFSKVELKELQNPMFLHSLLTDYYMPYIYLTYFHILNERSLEWLDKFDDDYHFIALNVKLDRYTETAIGPEYFGSRMKYVNSIRDIEQEGSKKFYSACMTSIEYLFEDKNDIILTLQIYNTLFFPLLCREEDEKYTDLENEFRIISYDCPLVKNGIMHQKLRNVTIFGRTGIKYTGVLNAGIDTYFKSSLKVLTNPYKLLSEILVEEKGMITIDSNFKSIDIREISSEYQYLGGKMECANFIKNTLKKMPIEEYVYRVVLRHHKIDELKNVVYAPGFMKVDY